MWYFLVSLQDILETGPAGSGSTFSRKDKTMNIIDAGAAHKLAGLQIDQLQKVREGIISLGDLEWFNNLSKKDRVLCFNFWKGIMHQEFSFILDLGVIVVPKGYDHATRLASFKEQNYKKFYHYNNNITDEHFPKPTRILKPGDKLRVKIFGQTGSKNVRFEERMQFLKSQNAVFTGAQGASLVFEQKRGKLPKGFCYCSFDEKDQLWKDSSNGYHTLPFLSSNPKGLLEFNLGYVDGSWIEDPRLLCFYDEPRED